MRMMTPLLDVFMLLMISVLMIMTEMDPKQHQMQIALPFLNREGTSPSAERSTTVAFAPDGRVEYRGQVFQPPYAGLGKALSDDQAKGGFSKVELAGDSSANYRNVVEVLAELMPVLQHDGTKLALKHVTRGAGR